MYNYQLLFEHHTAVSNAHGGENCFFLVRKKAKKAHSPSQNNGDFSENCIGGRLASHMHEFHAHTNTLMMSTISPHFNTFHVHKKAQD
jgi:hypothetical protein